MKNLNFPLSLMILLALQFVVSCSSEPTSKNDEDNLFDKKYSTSTEKEFEAIEKGDSPRSSAQTKKSIPAKPSRELQERAPRPPVKEAVKSPVKEVPEIIPTGQLSSKNQERLQEINQNLAFYCMKHRKDDVFSSEENCLKFTKRVLNDCEKKHKLINTVMVNCIKERLKKRQ